MDNIRILEQTGRGWWTSDELPAALNLSGKAAAVFKARAIKRGDLLAIKRGICVLPGWMKKATEAEKFRLANILQTPSYVSLLSALSAAGISTQIPASVCESVNPIRSRVYQVEGNEFRFFHIPKDCYFGFGMNNGLFIAEPEKALVDAIYLSSLGRYSLDRNALDIRKLDGKKLKKYSMKFPERTRLLIAGIMGK